MHACWFVASGEPHSPYGMGWGPLLSLQCATLGRRIAYAALAKTEVGYSIYECIKHVQEVFNSTSLPNMNEFGGLHPRVNSGLGPLRLVG